MQKTRPGATRGEKAGGDSEVLSLILAVDTNEVLAAMEAGKKKLPQPVAEYAKMLRTEHDKDAAGTMKLGLKIDVMPLEGEAFSAKYVEAMVNGHTEVLGMIDGELIKSAENEAVKKHLAATRARRHAP